MDVIQQRPRDYQRRARSLANLLNAFRSAALFHPPDRSRRAFVERALYDARFDRLAEADTEYAEALPSARAAAVDFCLSRIGVRTFGQRLRDAFRHRRDGGPRPLQAAAAAPDDGFDDDGDADEPTSSTSPLALGAGMSRVDGFWSAVYDRLRWLALVTGTANDGDDARVEFAREFTMDLCAGLPGMVGGAADDAGPARLAVETECLGALFRLGFLNKSMVSSRTMMMDSLDEEADGAGPFCAAANTAYTVVVFGSNHVLLRSDAGFTVRPAPDGPSAPPALESDDEARAFTEYLKQFCGGDFVPDQDACRAAALERGAPAVTSLSRNDLSLQLTFAMTDGRFYTANLFYLRGGQSCDTDFRYDRRFASNACHCENRLDYWRLAVSVAALDGTRVEMRTDADMTGFVIDMVRAFHLTVGERPAAELGGGGGHMYANKFTGLLFVNYVYDSRALGGMDVGGIGNAAPDDSPASVCPLHRWLRDHTNAAHWRSVAPRSLVSMLSRVPQMLVVYRPIVSEAAAEDNGPGLFVNYKTFDDVVSKYVLLTLDTLRNGYANELRGVSYKSGHNYWVFSGGAPGGGGEPSWLRAADRFAEEPSSSGDDSDGSVSSGGGGLGGEEAAARDLFSNPQRDVDELFRQTFSAPSRLFVHAGVLARLGFNLTSVGAVAVAGRDVVAARTFTHADRGDGRNTCTVICSSPTIVIDEATGRPVETFSRRAAAAGLLVHRHPPSQAPGRLLRPVEGAEDAGAFAETVASLNEYWPGVSAVKVSFKDRALRRVCFVFFAAADGSGAVRRLTDEGLTALYRASTRSRAFLPPPVVFTLQQMYVHFHRGAEEPESP